MLTRRISIIALLLTILVWAVCYTASTKLHADKPQPPPGILFEPGIVFGKGSDQDLQLDLARPKTQKGKAPALVMIHGGGWVGGDRSDFHSLQFSLAQSGIVCISVQYRLAPQSKFPAQIEDVKAAVRWLRAHADQYQVDPERIAAFGASAGAHLAVLLALTSDQPKFEGQGGNPEQSSAVKAAVALAGPYDLTLGYNSSTKQNLQEGTAVRGMLISFLGGSPDDVPGQYRDASPITYVRKDQPPLLLCHGEMDTLVLVEQADIMSQKIQSIGASVDYLRIPDGTHNGFGKDQNQHLLHIVEFLKKQLGL